MFDLYSVIVYVQTRFGSRIFITLASVRQMYNSVREELTMSTAFDVDVSILKERGGQVVRRR